MKSQVLHYIKELKKLIDKGLVYKDNAKKEASESSSVSLITGWKSRSGDIVGIRDITNLVTKHHDAWKKAHSS